jgi:hypothetical protein
MIMKAKNIFILIGISLFLSSGVFAQAKLTSGDMKALKGQSEVILKYDYTNMGVGKYKSADEYTAEKVAEMNKKKEGSGDAWLEKWKSDRTEKFEPAFRKDFNGEVDSYALAGKDDSPNAKYTLIIRTTFTEPGFNASMAIGFAKKPATIDVTIELIETANPGTVLGTVEIKKVQSKSMGGYDYDTGGRIESCYERAGEYFGKYLVKNVLK